MDDKVLIPRTFHRIWIGPNKPPAEFLKLGDTWSKHNPGWEVRFWTEANIPRLRNQDIFNQIGPWSGKADVVRLELIYDLGGVYVDFDFECFKCFDPLLAGHDHFFTSEPYYPKRNFGGHASNAIFGARARHPLVEMLMNGVAESFRQGFKLGHLAGPEYFERMLKGQGAFFLPPELFFPYNYDERHLRGPKTGEEYAAHYLAELGR